MDFHQILEKSDIPKSACVLDIETTGFSRNQDHVVAIGIQTSNRLLQWMAYAPGEERLLLEQALPVLNNKTILSYNGEAFDLPFLEARAAVHGIQMPDWLSRDYYAFLRKHRHFFRFPNLKLQTLQASAGIKRTDTLSGATIAALAKKLPDPATAESILEHNADDVRGTTALLPFFTALEAELQILKPAAGQLDTLDLHRDVFRAFYQMDQPTACPVVVSNTFGEILWEEHLLTLAAPLHTIAAEDGPHRAAVTPGSAIDAAAVPLPRPFLSIEAPDGYVAANVHALLSTIWNDAFPLKP